MLLSSFRHSLMLLCCYAASISADTLYIAAEDSWPPYSDSQGQGISQQLVRAALQTAGHDLRIEAMPYARALTLADYGDADAAWNVTLDDSTRLRFHFGQQPLLRASGYFYYPRGREQSYQSLADVPDNTRIAVINNYEYGNTFVAHQARFQLVRVSTQEQIIKLLLSGRAEMAIMFDRVADYTMQQTATQGQLSRGALNHVSDIYLAFNKSKASSLRYARDLDRGLAEIRASGRYDDILRQSYQHDLTGQ